MLLALLIVPSLWGFGQQNEASDRYPGEGLVRATATFSVGFMNRQTLNGYLHGIVEYYVDDRVSVRGDGFLSLFSSSKTADTAIGINLSEPLLMNHSLFVGGSYHFGKQPELDPYLGIQPGVSFSKYNEFILGPNGDLIQGDMSVSPVLSALAGFNYYSGKYFHLFVEGRYIRGIHMAGGNVKYLDEFRLSFGIGFDIR